MTVNVRFRAIDIPMGVGNGNIVLPEGSTVEAALSFCVESYDIELSVSELLKSLFLINSKPAQSDSVLTEGDSLAVVRLMAGG